MKVSDKDFGSECTKGTSLNLNWSTKRFGDMAVFRNGLNFVRADNGDSVKVIGVSDFQHHFKISYDNLDTVQVSGVLGPDDYLHNKDLLFVRSNGNKMLIGRCILVTSLFEPVSFSGFTIRARITDPLLLPVFAGFYFQSEMARSVIHKAGEGSHISNLSQGVLASLEIPVPPIREQHAVVEALSDVDGLLGALDRIIAKKRDLKQAAMQQLLTGRTRLPGFNKKWQQTTLGEIGESIIGLTYKPDDVVDHGLLVLRSSNVQNERLCFEDNVYVNCHVPGRLLTRTGDILVCVRNGSRDLIGKSAVIDDSAAGMSFGAFMTIYRTKHWRFISQAFRGYDIQRQIRENLGATINQITNKDMRSLRVELPPEDEQDAISEVLTDMDAELAALEQRREKTRLLKQGMMQELLTGRVRLLAETTNVVPFPAGRSPTAPTDKPHNWQINEAVVIAVLVERFGSERFPLGRKRYTKLSYLLHRHVERTASGYLKKAAGPYNPATRYKGPEGIAQRNGYVRTHTNGQYEGFVAADKIADALAYFQKWYGDDALAWLDQFRYKKNDELELIATVDMAMEDLRRAGTTPTLDAVKKVIHDHPEWEAKLSRPIFADTNIAVAMKTCEAILGGKFT